MIKNEIEIIAGRPSSGKTLLVSQICRDNIKSNQPILYFSIELSKSHLSQNYAIPKEVKRGSLCISRVTRIT